MFLTAKSLFFSVSLSQGSSVQMCDVMNEVEQEKERCENSTAGNVTSGDSFKTISSSVVVQCA